ncbi:hypothetical protein HAX54_031968, partial [Datura stramonium]|nr:hypothetical protein [Datura stramonium]
HMKYDDKSWTICPYLEMSGSCLRRVARVQGDHPDKKGDGGPTDRQVSESPSQWPSLGKIFTPFYLRATMETTNRQAWDVPSLWSSDVHRLKIEDFYMFLPG